MLKSEWLVVLVVGAGALRVQVAPRPRGVALRMSNYVESLGGAGSEAVADAPEAGASEAAAPAAEAAPAAAEGAAASSTTAVAAPNLSESVLEDFSARSERNLEVARLQTQLERSQMRRRQVEEVVGEELAALRFQLEREVAAEEDRKRSASALKAQLEAAKRAKEATCAREEQLLVQLQDVAQRTDEAAVAASLGAAIETKAGLVAIELLLIEDVTECVAQVGKEEATIDLRVEAMRETLAGLPAADDAEALRLYSWGQVEALQEELRKGAVAIAETEASVAALRQRINDALDQRDAVIGSAPVLGVAAADAQTPQNGKASPDTAAPPAPRRGAVKALDLADLDEGGLQDAVASSASATAQSFADLGKSLLAFGGAFANSEDQREAALLLGAASNETSALTSKLSTVGDDLAQDDAAALAKDTAAIAANAAKKAGGALAKSAAAAKKSAQTADLGASTIDAFTALGNTAASAGLLAFKLAKGATGDLQETLKAKAPKDFDP